VEAGIDSSGLMDGVRVAVGFYGERSVLEGAGNGGGTGCEFVSFNIGRRGEFGWLEVTGVREEVFSVCR
jgi:hypothetical protein